MQADIKIKTPANKFFNIYVKQPENFPEAFPADFKNNSFVVERVSKIDYGQKHAVWDVIDGYLAETYANSKMKLHCIPKCEGSIARWTFEYMKKKPDDPEPTEAYMRVVRHTILFEGFCNEKP
ncbi:hypothetical protein ACFE04_030107 [Oxalis oulophora]